MNLVNRLISPHQRLDLLRSITQQRKWYSLDDKRICLVCDRVFTGHQIEITRDRRGRYIFQCPTTGCPSDASHWLLCEISPARSGQMNFSGDFTFPQMQGAGAPGWQQGQGVG